MLEQDYEIYKKKQGARIRKARRIADLTQPELAEKMTAELGFEFGDDVKVSRIETGKQDVSGRELAALVVILNQPAAWLQGIEDEGATLHNVDHRPRRRAGEWFRRPIDITAEAPVRLAA